jgi:hypothetical protein
MCLGRTSWQQEVCEGRGSSLHGRQEVERKEGTGTRYTYERHAPNDILLLTRFLLLKFPELS